jgi:L-malate glycosyltransferase
VPHSIGEKRVLQVVLSLNPGGTERLVVEIVKRLLHEMPMAVCCLDEDGSWAGDLKAHGVDVVSLNRTSGFKPVLGRAIAHAARRHRASVMHCHHYSPFVYGCISRIWYPGCRIIFTEHGRLDTSPPSPKRRLANRALRTIPDEVFAVSQDLRRHLAAEGFREADVDVIYNGIDVGPQPDARARQRVRTMLGVDAGALVVGTIARLDPVKDLGTLVRATIDVARETPVLLMIVGDGPDRERLRALAAESHGACTVRFLGHRDDARELLAGCDIYANSSVSEGVSLTILEAMAAGLPVVATRLRRLFAISPPTRPSGKPSAAPPGGAWSSSFHSTEWCASTARRTPARRPDHVRHLWRRRSRERPGSRGAGCGRADDCGAGPPRP